MLYCDTMVNVDLTRFYAAHAASGASAILVFHPDDHPQDSDLVEPTKMDEFSLFTDIPTRPASCSTIQAMLYVLKASALWADSCPRLHWILPSIYFASLRERVHLHGYRSSEYVKDAGTPERFWSVWPPICAQAWWPSRALDVKRPAVFLDRDGTINEEVSYLTRPEQLKLIPGSAAAIRQLRQADTGSLWLRTDRHRARRPRRGGAAPHSRPHGDGVEPRRCISGRYLLCPHHPDKGFDGERAELKFECECRKPGDGMVRQAVTIESRFGGRAGSLATARATCRRRTIAGCARCSLRTGIAGRDQRYAVAPEFVFDDLSAAANFIVQHSTARYHTAAEDKNHAWPGNSIRRYCVHWYALFHVFLDWPCLERDAFTP